MTKGPSRRHHFLPQTYLAGFTDDGTKQGKFYVLNTETGEAFRTTPKGVAVERDFNRVDIEGHSIDALEDALSRFEGELGPALHRVRTTAQYPSPDDLNIILNLMSLVATRNPALRESFKKFNADIAKHIMQLATSDKQIWESEIRKAHEAGHLESADASYEDAVKFIEADDFTVETPLDMHHQVEFEAQDEVLKIIGKRYWSLLVVEDDNLICCDRPVVLWPKPGALRGPMGLGTEMTEIIFPISSRLALYGVYEDALKPVISLNTKRVAGFNRKIVRCATTYVYSAEKTFLVLLEGGVFKVELDIS
jgi:hypothetical protein